MKGSRGMICENPAKRCLNLLHKGCRTHADSGKEQNKPRMHMDVGSAHVINAGGAVVCSSTHF